MSTLAAVAAISDSPEMGSGSVFFIFFQYHAYLQRVVFDSVNLPVKGEE